MNLQPDPKYYTKFIWTMLVISIIILLCTGVIHLTIFLVSNDLFGIKLTWWIGLSSLIIMWIISYPIGILWIKNLSYTIEKDRVTINKGILTKTQQNIPHRTVTDFALQRTLFDRILGIGSVQIQTAGQSANGTGYEGILAGLTDYESIHGQLRDLIKEQHPKKSEHEIATAEYTSNDNILNNVLTELVKIRKILESK